MEWLTVSKATERSRRIRTEEREAALTVRSAVSFKSPDLKPVLWARSHLRWTGRQWKSVLWSDESTFQLGLGKMDVGFFVLKMKKWWYGGASVPTAWVICIYVKVPLMRRLMLEYLCLSGLPAVQIGLLLKIYEIMKRRIRQWQPRIPWIWAKIPFAKLQQFISSVPKQLHRVIKRKGDATQW